MTISEFFAVKLRRGRLLSGKHLISLFKSQITHLSLIRQLCWSSLVTGYQCGSEFSRRLKVTIFNLLCCNSDVKGGPNNQLKQHNNAFIA